MPSPGDLPYPRIKPGSPALWGDTLSSEPPGKPINPKWFLKTQTGLGKTFFFLNFTPCFGQYLYTFLTMNIQKLIDLLITHKKRVQLSHF